MRHSRGSAAFSLDQKTIFITGAAGGIGSETARICAELGARLVLADLNEPSPLASELRAAGIDVQTVAFDVRDRLATEHVFDHHGTPDALVVNAGYCPWDDWEEDGWDEEFRTVIDINVMGVINITRACLKRMTARGSGKMVLVSSVAARIGGLRASPHYVAAKGGVSSVAKWLARKAAPHGVQVNAVCPGATISNMTQGQVFDTAAIPARRMATAREIALPITFLCTAGSDYMVGATLDVNGGVFMS